MIDGVLKLANADRFLKSYPSAREAAEKPFRLPDFARRLTGPGF